MSTTNAQAALQAAATLHARIDGQVKDISRRNVKESANSFKTWLDDNTEAPLMTPTRPIVARALVDWNGF